MTPASTLALISDAKQNYIIDPSDVNVPNGYIHYKEAASTGMEKLYKELTSK